VINIGQSRRHHPIYCTTVFAMDHHQAHSPLTAPNSVPNFTINPVRTPTDLEAVIVLFRAYAVSLGIDLTFQDFEREMTIMPGKYAPPGGEILLACDGANTPVGCIALRPLVIPGCCEMKRLFVLPAGRGLNIGRALVEAILICARNAGYAEVKLDTLSTMIAAQSLYRKFGFVETEPYYHNPNERTVYMSCMLRPPSVVVDGEAAGEFRIPKLP